MIVVQFLILLPAPTFIYIYYIIYNWKYEANLMCDFNG